MSLDNHVYVGPYIVAPKNFDYSEWQHTVTDGRGEAGHSDENLFLVPNNTDLIDARDFSDPNTEPTEIVASDIDTETQILWAACKDMINYCRALKIKIEFKWGIVLGTF